MSRLASFPTVNCNNLSVKNTKQQVTKSITPTFTLTTSTSQMTYLNFSNVGYINLGQLNEACNFNIYEFRIMSSTTDNTILGCTNCNIVDLDNVSRTSVSSTTKKYYKFQYIYQFSGESIIHTYYQLGKK